MGPSPTGSVCSARGAGSSASALRTAIRSTDLRSAIRARVCNWATTNEVRDATIAGHSVISGGIYLDVLGPGDTRPGDEARGTGDTARFTVTVQAALWIDVDRLEVIVDGATLMTLPMPTAPPDGL